MKEKLLIKEDLTSQNPKKMSRVLKWVFLSTFIFLCSSLLHAQISISGIIRDSDGGALPGVNIVEKDSYNGTISDLNGNFSLSVSSEDAVLEISFVGYKKMEIPIEGRSTIEVTMEEDLTVLDEVVVVGYGTLRKTEVTGSYSTVKGEDLVDNSLGSLDKALQGKATGLQVSGSGGSPGAPQRILVRGTNSISAGTDPLIIVDGIPIYSTPNGLGGQEISPLSSINPNDIESIDVLKDAAATSIYGSRGSNGVILITTKNGSGKGKLEVSFSTGVNMLTKTMKDMNLADRDLWIKYQDEVYQNGGIDTLWHPYRILNLYPGEEGTEAPAFGAFTRERAFATNSDWWEGLMRDDFFGSDAASFNEINISGGDNYEKGSIYASFNHRNEKGVVLNNDFKRYSARLNAIFNPVERLEISAKISGSAISKNHVRSRGGGINNSGQNGFGMLVTNTYDWIPIYEQPEYNETHPTGYWYPVTTGHVIAQVDKDLRIDERDMYRGIGVVGMKYSIPGVEGLSLKANAGLDVYWSAQNTWESRAIDLDGIGTAMDHSRLRTTINYNVLTEYVRDFDDHSITAVGGVESQRGKQDARILSGSDLQGTYKELGSPINKTGLGVSRGGNEEYLLAVLGRVNYSYKKKYLMGISLRKDASSRFSPENRWQTFPAVSAGWILSNESFFSSAKEKINFLKIRASYGKTGNQNLPNGTIEDIIKNNKRYGNYSRNGQVGSSIRNVASPNVTWETTDNYDIGIDYGFLGDRINGSLGYFYQNVSDLILQVSMIPSAGIPDIWFNIGGLVNRGFEFDVNAVIMNKGSFLWKANFNITTNKNEITSLTPDLDQNGAGSIQSGRFYLQTGLPLGTFYLPKWAGINAQHGYDQVYARNDSVWLNEYHTEILTDTLGNLVILPSTEANNDNNSFVQYGKSSLPKYFGGFGTSFSYKGIDLSAYFVFSGGNYIYNGVSEQYYYAAYGQGRVSADLEGNTWQEPGDTDAKYPRHMYVNKYNSINYENDFDRWLEKGDYLRLRNLTVGYTFPKKISNKMGFANFRLALSGSNLFTITKYSGWDPELAKVDGSFQEQNIAQGIVGTPGIPSLKSYMLNINISF